MKRPARISTTSLLVYLSGALTACAPHPDPPQNLLLITIDTLRPDRLSFSGLQRRTSPTIDRLASEGGRFRSVYSQSGWTLPSMATILTGHHSNRHGAINVEHPIASDLPTLATVLSRAGFQTSAFVSHVMLSAENGFAQGFEIYDDTVLEVGHPHRVSTAKILTDRVLARAPSTESRFFVWVHYFDPHFDYLTHKEWADWGSGNLDRYDGEIAYTDRQISRLLEEFDRLGLMEDTLTVLTADHGEAFGERGTWHHASVFEEVLRVPLILHGSDRRPAEVERPAQQIDLMPTLLNLLQVATPGDLPGTDLFDPEPERKDIFVERFRPRPFVQQALIRGTDKLIKIEVLPEARGDAQRIENAYKRTRLRPGIYLFDLGTDPGETENLYRPDNPKAIEMMAALDRYFSTPRTRTDTLSVDVETRDRLEALGYLD